MMSDSATRPARWRAARPLAAAVMALGACLAVSAPAASAAKVTKVPLFSMDRQLFDCNQGGVSAPHTEGFAIIDFSRDAVSADVRLKDGIPNVQYLVGLVQTPTGSEGCSATDATLTTNRHGDGSAHFREARVASATGAYVRLIFGPVDFEVTPLVSAP